jgi:hypothetical protein
LDLEGLILQYHPLFILLCLALGAGYAYVLYFFNKKLKERSKAIFYLLTLIRFLSVAVISFLLLAPLFKSINETTQKPIIILAQDYSLSLKNAYSEKELNALNSKIKDAASKLAKKYSVQSFSFGGIVKSGLSDSFNLKSSNMSSVFDMVNSIYDNKQIAGIIISSDGIYNEGANPDYTEHHNLAPIYTIALGDTSIRKDVFINNIYHNNIAFLKDKLNIKADIVAKNCKNEKIIVELSEYDPKAQKSIIGRQKLSINSNDFFTTIIFNFDLKSPGVKRYSIRINGLPGEISHRNNIRDFFIEVIDSRTEVLIFANSPHPDITAIKDLLLSKKNYNVNVKYSGENIDVKKYDCIVFHNLPSSKNNLNTILPNVQEGNIATFFVLGNQTNINQFNNVQSLLKISNFTNNQNEVQAVQNKDFTLFTLPDIQQPGIINFPPLLAPFGTYSLTPESSVLYWQKIKNINTSYPLVVFSSNDKFKTGVLAASNFFKWKLFEYQQTGSNNLTKAIIDQAIQYLTIKKDKSQWQVNTNNKVYDESENIIFTGELYNDNFQQINEPEAFLKIRDSKNKEYDFTFTRVENYYEIDAGVFPPGVYNYIASVENGGKKHTKKSQFTIVAKDLEFYDMLANHSLLNKMSSKSNGQMYFEKNIDQLVDKLNKQVVKPVIYSSENTKHLLDYKILFFLILLLLTTEWAIRKLFGSI